MNRLEANDMVMGALFNAWKLEGRDIRRVKEIYEEQRAVIEAEELLNEKEKENE